MLRKLNIGPRLLVLLAVQIVVVLAIGAMTISTLRLSLDTTESLNEKVSQEARLISLSDAVRSDLVGTAQDITVGRIRWPEAADRLERARRDFESGWKEFLGSLSAGDQEFVTDVLAGHVDGVRKAFDDLRPIVAAHDRAFLSLFVTNDLEYLVGPFLNALIASTSLQQLEAEHDVAAAGERNRAWLAGGLGLVAAGVLIALALGFAVYRSIASPLGAIAATVDQVAAGDLEARTEETGSDELGALGAAFDGMLTDRVTSLSRAQAENERLNESVISLLEAVSKLSQRDLTVRVPVTEDVTGPVADSLNLLTDETAKVLQVVRVISDQVAGASAEVKSQSDRVSEVASKEQVEVAETAAALSNASKRMTSIARLAQACAKAADEAIASTQSAMQTVTGTVTGINGIRDTIRETEKRIKRLGERSQEISGVVSLINTIAERTHILALNASMHAASAGEAGRGFAVVADEVQRLAENARDATSQISTLVSNIQTETNATVSTMNEAISQVVAGSQLAEQAGREMEGTRDSTANLVAMVQRIAEGSLAQAKTSVGLMRRAEGIRESTEVTSRELAEQSAHTVTLLQQAGQLVDAVSVFRLPAGEATDPAGEQTGHFVVESIPVAVNA